MADVWRVVVGGWWLVVADGDNCAKVTVLRHATTGG